MRLVGPINTDDGVLVLPIEAKGAEGSQPAAKAQFRQKYSACKRTARASEIGAEERRPADTQTSRRMQNCRGHVRPAHSRCKTHTCSRCKIHTCSCCTNRACSRRKTHTCSREESAGYPRQRADNAGRQSSRLDLGNNRGSLKRNGTSDISFEYASRLRGSAGRTSRRSGSSRSPSTGLRRRTCRAVKLLAFIVHSPALDGVRQKELPQCPYLRQSAPFLCVLLEFPLAIVQRAHFARLEPSRNAVLVERVLDSVSPDDKSRATLHAPQATVHSSAPVVLELAWHSMHMSMMWLRQIAQLST